MNPAEYDRMDAVERDHWWYRGLRDLIGRSIRRLEAPRASPLRILDAGCGTGETLRWLNDRLHPAYLGGFDISPVALARAAKKVPAADLYLADICDPEVHVPELDLVLSCDAADVPGIDAALPGLCRLVQALRPGGMFILNLPAFSWRFATFKAATTAAPEEIPTNNPSSRGSRRAMLMASSLLTVITSSM